MKKVIATAALLSGFVIGAAYAAAKATAPALPKALSKEDLWHYRLLKRQAADVQAQAKTASDKIEAEYRAVIEPYKLSGADRFNEDTGEITRPDMSRPADLGAPAAAPTAGKPARPAVKK